MPLNPAWLVRSHTSLRIERIEDGLVRSLVRDRSCRRGAQLEKAERMEASQSREGRRRHSRARGEQLVGLGSDCRKWPLSALVL